MENNKKTSQSIAVESEIESKLLLHVIEQVVESILIRDKYIRVLFTVQFLLMIFLLLIQVFKT